MNKPHSPDFLKAKAMKSPASNHAKKERLILKSEKVKAKKERHHQTRRPDEGRERKNKYTKKYIRWLIFSFLGIIVLLIVPPAISLARAAFTAQSAKVSLERAKEKAQAMDVAGAKEEIISARDSLIQTRSLLSGTGYWRDLPVFGTQLRALQDATAAGAETLEAATNLMDVVEVVTDALRGGTIASQSFTTGIAPTRSYNELTKDEKRELLNKFSAALPQVRLARDKVDLAMELWKRVPNEEMAKPLRDALEPLAVNLPIFKQAMDQVVPLIETAVPLAGYPDELRYLVILQNPDEMRPAGGFVGTVGTMTLDAGDLTEFDFNDIYNIDNPASYNWKEIPPKPIAERLGVNAWYMRDANWSPDFPESAARLLDFYTREVEIGTGKPLADPPDTVLALEPGLFEDLLRLTGSITVNGKIFTPENFFDVLEYEVEQGFLEKGIPLTNRKDLIEKLGAELVNKLKAMPASRWPEIVNSITTSLERKQIMIFSKNQELLSILDDRGWTGRTKATQGDFLWVIDANLAALKTDGVMDKKISYKLNADDPKNITATVTLTYKNNTKTIDWRYTRYRSYTRVYVPDGSQLISSSGAMKDDLYRTGGRFTAGPIDVTHELGKTVFGAFWSIEPGKTGTLSYTYTLPARVGENIMNGDYRLDWPKQAGADSTGLTLDLFFGKNLISAVPSEDEEEWGDAKYEYVTDSLEDRTFVIKL
ncbi:MAG: DUF4012 domain-containing protein [Patescibacteria group bacterium]